MYPALAETLQKPDTELRLFDTDGNELATNNDGAAPDEEFSRDPYLEYTADSAGTYYVGVSQLGNRNYDPNITRSGSGWTFPEVGVYFGPYELTASIEDGTTEPPSPQTSLDFEWTGQIAGFSVEGQFSYDETAISDPEGIVREEDLTDFDVSFFDPDGNLLETYEDNHLTFPEFNFAYDPNTGEILQDGYFLGDDGINIGEKTPVGEDEFTGLNLWSRPEFNSQGEVPPPHIHFDDWSDEFGFPTGFSFHEDVAFFTRTTQELLDTGRVGETYIDEIQDSLDEIGSRVTVTSVDDDVAPTFEPVFGSIDGDTIEVKGDNQLIFAGDLGDLVDASTGDGNNRIYAGSSDDTLLLGSNDRVLAGAGDDQIFTTSGGDNTITGGEGADSFWIATAELPESTNTITDFTAGEDVIGIAGLGIGYSDLSITDTDAGVLVSTNGADLALFTNTGLDAMSSTSFAIASEDNFAFA